MTPSWWQFVLLTLAAYRTWRLITIDTLPPIERVRQRILFREITPHEWEPRQTLIDLFGCAYCSGFWVGLAWWAGWLAWPHATIVVAVPFAVSGVIGLLAKNLDA